jgi:hypothetical protein
MFNVKNVNLLYPFEVKKSINAVLPVQLKPFPVYPTTHAHVKFPGVLIQVANKLQPPLFVEHSLISGTPTHILVFMDKHRCKVSTFEFYDQTGHNAGLLRHMAFKMPCSYIL